jgi:hypothetical protein
MEGAPVVILLVGLAFPIAVLLLALVLDAVALVWVLYRLWHDEWSATLSRQLHRLGSVPHWHAVRNH